MILSIVTGTFNRLAHLQRMIASARVQIPRHIGHEFIVVDGGSTDGTLAWVQAQPDIRTIGHGELRGAIRAFCDGAQMAQGDYVLLANDDIEFHPHSIMRAVAYLEQHRACGAVAFADNRGMQMGHGNQYRVERMPAISAEGKPTALTYAQVGLFRRWLGDQIGWWGADDPYMRNSRTYGGDNFLSSRIWELGYSVDAVDGCTIDDLIAEDALRVHSRKVSQNDSAQFYARFPRGPYAKAHPEVPNPQHERIRAVVMDIHEPRLPARTAKERGLGEAMGDAALTWHIDYVNEPYDLPAIIRAWQPHLLLVQMHDTSRINAAALKAARAAKPDMVIVNWNGDAHEKGLIAPDILEALREVDLQTIINLKVMPVYEREGIRAAYWQIGYKDPGAPYQGDVAAHQVLFQGNCYDDRRTAIVEALRSTGLEVGVYGSCPGSMGNSHYDFAYSRALYERCIVAVSDTYPNTEGFVSNRLLQALAAGAFVLQEYSPRLDELTGLCAGEHFIEWRDLDDLRQKLLEWSAPDHAAQREEIASRARDFVRENFSYDAQVRKLWQLLT